MTDANVVAALGPQLATWRAALDGGAERLGWKIGLNVPEVQQKLGITEPVIGHMTSRTRLASGATYTADAGAQLRAEAEIALLMGDDGAVAGLAAAIELVDLAGAPGDLEGILAGNIFHRGVVLGEAAQVAPEAIAGVRMTIDGETSTAPVPDDFSDVVALVARLLGSQGERLEAGDWIIAGALINLPVVPGNRVAVEVDGLDPVDVAIRV